MRVAIRVPSELASAAPRATVELVESRFPVKHALASGLAIIVLLQQPATADESGISFWLPAQFNSLSAAPQQPGWSLATVYYHTQVNAGAEVARSHEITIGRFSPNVNLNAAIDLKARADLTLAVPSYTFATPREKRDADLSNGQVGCRALVHADQRNTRRRCDG